MFQKVSLLPVSMEINPEHFQKVEGIRGKCNFVKMLKQTTETKPKHFQQVALSSVTMETATGVQSKHFLHNPVLFFKKLLLGFHCFFFFFQKFHFSR